VAWLEIIRSEGGNSIITAIGTYIVSDSRRGTSGRINLRRAIVTFTNSDDAVVGNIIDIGRDGLTFLCKSVTLVEGEQVELDILDMGQDIYLPNVLCTILAIEPGTNPAGLHGGLFKRVVGAFPRLTAEQSETISLLISQPNPSRSITGNVPLPLTKSEAP